MCGRTPYISKWLIDAVPQIAARMQERCYGKVTNARYLRGCTIALNIWFYKVIGTGKKEHCGRTPRILCYGKNSFQKQASLGLLMSLFDGKEVFHYCRWFIKVSFYFVAFPFNIVRFCLLYKLSILY